MSDYRIVNARGLLRHMRRPRCIILIGLPASGKSTLARQLAEQGYEHLSADLIRTELYGDANILGDANVVFPLLYQRFEEALAKGSKVVVDNTNITRTRRRPFIERARRAGCKTELVLFDEPLAACLQRNEARERHVPREIIVSLLYTLRHAGLPARHEGHLTAVRLASAGRYQIVPVENVLIMGRRARSRSARAARLKPQFAPNTKGLIQTKRRPWL